jgi:hypothetical protein
MAHELILTALTGVLRGRKFTIRAPAYCVLGRSSSCHVCLPGDGTVSRRHCLVELDGGSA